MNLEFRCIYEGKLLQRIQVTYIAHFFPWNGRKYMNNTFASNVVRHNRKMVSTQKKYSSTSIKI